MSLGTLNMILSIKGQRKTFIYCHNFAIILNNVMFEWKMFLRLCQSYVSTVILNFFFDFG